MRGFVCICLCRFCFWSFVIYIIFFLGFLLRRVRYLSVGVVVILRGLSVFGFWCLIPIYGWVCCFFLKCIAAVNMSRIGELYGICCVFFCL